MLGPRVQEEGLSLEFLTQRAADVSAVFDALLDEDGPQVPEMLRGRFDPARVALDKLPEDKRGKMKKPDEVKQEAEQINARYGVWAYRLSSYKGKDFAISREEVVHKIEKKDKQG